MTHAETLRQLAADEREYAQRGRRNVLTLLRHYRQTREQSVIRGARMIRRAASRHIATAHALDAGADALDALDAQRALLTRAGE